jgi:hypothetical protein
MYLPLEPISSFSQPVPARAAINCEGCSHRGCGIDGASIIEETNIKTYKTARDLTIPRLIFRSFRSQVVAVRFFFFFEIPTQYIRLTIDSHNVLHFQLLQISYPAAVSTSISDMGTEECFSVKFLNDFSFSAHAAIPLK